MLFLQLSNILMKRKLVFGLLLLFVSTIHPGCTHKKLDGKLLYLKYLHSRLNK